LHTSVLFKLVSTAVSYVSFERSHPALFQVLFHFFTK
jgi:hypothetical protein